MARRIEPKCRLCRREGEKLFLKGTRCYTPKCAIERRNIVPGMHIMRGKLSDYGIQLREKQKMKRMYGLMEAQFRETFRKASGSRGITGEVLLQSLEKRLDNMVYRLGFCGSRAEARQFVLHGHFRVNDRKVTIPSYQVKAGDRVSVREKSRVVPRILESLEEIERRGVPTWLELDKKNFMGTVKTLPTREELTMPMQEHLVVEFYSK